MNGDMYVCIVYNNQKNIYNLFFYQCDTHIPYNRANQK